MTDDRQPDLLSDLSQLFELALSIGSSLDLHENCERFLTTLMTRRNLACAAVWWRQAEQQQLECIYANPALSEQSDTSTILGLLPLEGPHEISQRDAHELLGSPAIPRRCVLFPLGTRGVLLLGSHLAEAFSTVECGQLRNLLDKFAVAINGCLAHRSLLEAKVRNQQLALVAQHTDNAVVITDAEQHILWTNDGFTKLTGWASNEVLGRIPGRFLQGPDTDPVTVDEIRTAIAEDRGITAEIMNYHRNGDPYWVSMSINPIFGEDGRTDGYIAVERNVSTDREQRERLMNARDLLETQTEALEAARVAAEQASQAKSNFVAEMSHEFRTPLASILGLSDVLQTLIPNESAPVLEQLRRSATHLLDLVNGVLDLASIEAGRLDLDQRPVRLQELLADVHHVVAPRATARGLELRFPPVEETALTLLSDARRLRQILVNLIDNAIKYTDEGHVHVRLTQTGKRVELSVEDSGIGIPADRHAHLFDPFVRVDGIKATREGRGLGLSLAREFARALGGDIRVESEVGRGSRFTLSLPFALVPPDARTQPPSSAPETRHDASTTPDLKGMRLLVAEDTADLRQILAFYLEEAGATVEFATHGKEALELAFGPDGREQRFDLILMDVQMPIMDGLQATEALRERGYSGHITAVTAYALVEDRERCLAAGCNDWLGKPVDPESLYRHLRKVRSARTG